MSQQPQQKLNDEQMQYVVRDRETKYLLRFSATLLSIIGILIGILLNNFNNKLDKVADAQIETGKIITNHDARISMLEVGAVDFRQQLRDLAGKCTSDNTRLYALKPDEIKVPDRREP